MPLLIDAVSKISNNSTITIKPNKDILYKYLSNGNCIVQQSRIILPQNHHINTRCDNMTTEQKRKYMLLKYIRQYT